MTKISVIGAGHWGLALSSVLSDNQNEVLVYARNSEDSKALNEHKSRHFPGVCFSSLIKGTSSIDEALDFSDIILISIPVVSIMDFLTPYIDKLHGKTILLSSKGLFHGKSISTLLNDVNTGFNIAVLSGPSFSTEVVSHKKTAVVIASKDLNTAKRLQLLFNNNDFRVYTTTDIIGVEYCGAIKNVFAIVCGMMDGHGMGSNAKNAILTRGLSEMKRVISFVGGDFNTLFGLAGIGDIMLTCNSLESRNYSYGYYYPNAQFNTVEGLNTIKEIYDISLKNHLDMPIIDSLYQILFNHSSIDIEANRLMARMMKNE